MSSTGTQPPSWKEKTKVHKRADWIINDLVDQEVVTLPDDWLQLKATSISLYQADASLINVTEGKHADDVVERMLAIILSGGPIGDPPLPPT